MEPPPPSKPSKSCGACRHMGYRCTPDCILAPYFPNNMQARFVLAHRLFSYSRISRTLLDAGPLRDDAAAAIIYEVNARDRDPVGGTHRIVLQLQRDVQAADAELRFVLRCIEIARANMSFNAPPPPPPFYRR